MSRKTAASDAFRAVADPTRRALLDMLRDGERPVLELGRRFRMSQPALSQHLRVLREAGLVARRRDGRQRLYRLRPARLRPVAGWVMRYEEFWKHKLQALGEFLKEGR